MPFVVLRTFTAAARPVPVPHRDRLDSPPCHFRGASAWADVDFKVSHLPCPTRAPVLDDCDEAELAELFDAFDIGTAYDRAPGFSGRPGRTILGHARRCRCRGQAGVPVPADETTAWDEIRSRPTDDRLTLAPASDCESAGVVVRHDCQTSLRA
jgi:hypothetical protein